MIFKKSCNERIWSTLAIVKKWKAFPANFTPNFPGPVYGACRVTTAKETDPVQSVHITKESRDRGIFIWSQFRHHERTTTENKIYFASDGGKRERMLAWFHMRLCLCDAYKCPQETPRIEEIRGGKRGKWRGRVRMQGKLRWRGNKSPGDWWHNRVDCWSAEKYDRAGVGTQ